jgi:hypothetical protein
MKPLQIPNLSTLDEPPSWCNAHGHLDRSACVEVRVSEVRRQAGCVVHNGQYRPDGKGLTQLVSPLPSQQRARTGDGRVASGIITITAEQVHMLHAGRTPRKLAGDRRTPRAPVMRPGYWLDDRPFRCRVTRADPFVIPFDRGLEGNPNKGACRSKMIGLPETWSQPLRIEKWVFPKRIRPAYYLICPGTFLHRDVPEGKDPRLPPLSTCGSGRKATGCPQRALKLLLVQCTPREYRDAKAARLWIDGIPPRVVERYRAEINLLMARYGPIMPPRVLLCPRCLGAKYGNDPETVRQGWRRRNKRPDTTRTAGIRQRLMPTPPEAAPSEVSPPDVRESTERKRRLKSPLASSQEASTAEVCAYLEGILASLRRARAAQELVAQEEALKGQPE